MNTPSSPPPRPPDAAPARPAPRQLRGRAPRLSIGLKLFGGLFSAMLVVFFAFSNFTADATREAWARSFDDQATQTTVLVERLLRQGMLLHNKEAVHAALHDVASAPGLRSIRIYDMNGVVRFSTDDRERGTQATREDEVCIICHGEHFRTARDEAISRVLHTKDGAVMGQARVLRNAPTCAGAKCHVPPEEKVYLGVMDFQTSMAAVEQADAAARRNVAYGASVMALAGGAATLVLVWRFVRRPVLHLVGGMRAVAAGRLETRISLEESVEFNEIAHAFNQMTRDLEAAEERQRRWEDTLAEAVEAKTSELAVAHRRMLHMEKMASLGKLAAMVAHEINNPLAGILVYAKLLLRGLAVQPVSDEDRQEALRYVEVVRQESSRCGDIVRNLLSFARRSKTGFKEQSLGTIVDRAIMTVQHLMKTHSVSCKVESSLSDDRILCDENEVQQALVALLVNAVEAMPQGGDIRVGLTDEGSSRVVIRVTDTGVGIPLELQHQIFEPFFSTKGEEKGVGLGLAAVYGIVRRHEGAVHVESQPAMGATFVITLPRRPTERPETPDELSSDAAPSRRTDNARGETP